MWRSSSLQQHQQESLDNGQRFWATYLNKRYSVSSPESQKVGFWQIWKTLCLWGQFPPIRSKYAPCGRVFHTALSSLHWAGKGSWQVYLARQSRGEIVRTGCKHLSFFLSLFINLLPQFRKWGGIPSNLLFYNLTNLTTMWNADTSNHISPHVSLFFLLASPSCCYLYCTV